MRAYDSTGGQRHRRQDAGRLQWHGPVLRANGRRQDILDDRGHRELRPARHHSKDHPAPVQGGQRAPGPHLQHPNRLPGAVQGAAVRLARACEQPGPGLVHLR